MKRFRNFLIASVGFLVFALAVSLSGFGSAVARQAQECVKICDEIPLSTVVRNVITVIGDVKITNDSDSPIPTRVNGPIQIASSSRNAISTKASLLVTDVFQREVKITLEPNDVIGTASFNVPQSRLLVIEGWSGFAQMGSALQYPKVFFKSTANGDLGTYPVFAQPGGGGWFLYHPGWGGKAYADPGSTVEVTFTRSGVTGTATMTMTFTGHYIDQ
jgi:hypothetical protein